MPKIRYANGGAERAPERGPELGQPPGNKGIMFNLIALPGANIFVPCGGRLYVYFSEPYLSFEYMGTNAFAVSFGLLVFLIMQGYVLYREGWGAVKQRFGGSAGFGLSATLFNRSSLALPSSRRYTSALTHGSTIHG